MNSRSNFKTSNTKAAKILKNGYIQGLSIGNATIYVAYQEKNFTYTIIVK
jgi:hypothetical protein